MEHFLQASQIYLTFGFCIVGFLFWSWLLYLILKLDKKDAAYESNLALLKSQQNGIVLLCVMSVGVLFLLRNFL